MSSRTLNDLFRYFLVGGFVEGVKGATSSGSPRVGEERSRVISPPLWVGMVLNDSLPERSRTSFYLSAFLDLLQKESYSMSCCFFFSSNRLRVV